MDREFQRKTDLQLLAYRLSNLTNRWHHLTSGRLPSREFVYMIERCGSSSYRLTNMSTGHMYWIARDKIVAFKPDHTNTPLGLKRVDLVLRDDLCQSGIHARTVAR